MTLYDPQSSAAKPTLRYSKTGRELTESFEGCRLTAYQDSRGVWTIGFGHTKNVYPGLTCTPEQADQWLSEDIAWAETEVNARVHVPLNQNEFDSLVDFVFNLGSGNFDHSSLLRLVNEGDMEAAALEFEKWDRAGGVVVAGLLRRRIAERQLFQEPPH